MTKSTGRDKARQRQREWVSDVVRLTGKSATAIARDAGLAPTTLTRFLADQEGDGLLSALTVQRVAEAAGVPGPAAEPGERSGAMRSGLQEEGAPYAAQERDPQAAAIAAMIGGDPNRSAWTIATDALALAGVRPGDVIILDMATEPQNGDVVCAQVETGGGASTVFRLYRKPVLVGASLDPAAIRPEFVDGERVRVAGVMVALFRSR